MESAFNSTIQELYFDHGNTENWEAQMRLLSLNPILYLRDYRWAPEDLVKWKEDSGLCPAVSSVEWCCKEIKAEKYLPAPSRLSTGIGTYQTDRDGELYLCAILERPSGMVLSYSFGVYRSAELVGKALDNFFNLYEIKKFDLWSENSAQAADHSSQTADHPSQAADHPSQAADHPSQAADHPAQAAHRDITLLTSQNPLYRTKRYTEMLEEFPLIPLMTQKGSRGQAADVSTFFSQLMRKKGGLSFHTWQDGIDWLTMYLLRYNLNCGERLSSGRNSQRGPR